ncbi:hypothetical protein [Corallococcus llansteffanensis]|uniref:Carboxypeptidase regulatory-like domain-containing protein n=1 Tax=Corallococcus llansteffanensis TaxID=2316731 RepID=A0A3A8Q9P8_9BACT|nr:hypothetical protein [Corallococcus llansteffanensis]RKH65346.1 hypothetical protein D7V93_06050 [Corallococcus llansteffanensis]
MRPPLFIAVLLVCVAAVAWAEAPEVEATPGRLVLGQDQVVVVRVRVPEGAGPVRAAASSGTWEATRLEGRAERIFRWTPPPVRYPLWAVLAFWVEDGRPPEVTTVRVPLLGRTTLDVSTAPGAEVVVAVGEARFGPVKADGRGRAQVPVEVPPDAKEARVLATRGTLTTDRSAPLEVPSERPLVAALTPEPLSVEDGGWLVLEGVEGPVPPSDVDVVATGATVKADPPNGQGRFAVRPQAGAPRVSITVSWGDPSATDAARVQADVRPARSRPPGLDPAVDNILPFPPASPDVPTASRSRGKPTSLFLLGGASFARGANGGPLLALGVSVPLPLWRGRLAAEAEVGVRHAMLDVVREDKTQVHSRVWAFPLMLSMRVTLFQQGSLRLDGRAGGGVLPLRHQLSLAEPAPPDDFQTAVNERKLGAMGFLSVQGAYDLGRWSILTEVRAALAPVRTPSLDAELGGVSLAFGVGFTP